MANSEDVLEAARNHTRDFTKFDRAFQEYHLAEAHLILALAAEVRELRRQRDAAAGVCDNCTELEMTVAELRKDRERLMVLIDDVVDSWNGSQCVNAANDRAVIESIRALVDAMAQENTDAE